MSPLLLFLWSLASAPSPPSSGCRPLSRFPSKQASSQDASASSSWPSGNVTRPTASPPGPPACATSVDGPWTSAPGPHRIGHREQRGTAQHHEHPLQLAPEQDGD